MREKIVIRYDMATLKLCEAVADIDIGHRYYNRKERWRSTTLKT